MSEPDAPKSNAGRWITGVVLTVVIYVLGWGPVGVYQLKRDSSGKPTIQWLYQAYAPVTWLAHHSILERPFFNYWCWCFRLAGENPYYCRGHMPNLGVDD